MDCFHRLQAVGIHGCIHLLKKSLALKIAWTADIWHERQDSKADVHAERQCCFIFCERCKSQLAKQG